MVSSEKKSVMESRTNKGPKVKQLRSLPQLGDSVIVKKIVCFSPERIYFRCWLNTTAWASEGGARPP